MMVSTNNGNCTDARNVTHINIESYEGIKSKEDEVVLTITRHFIRTIKSLKLINV